MTESEKYTPLSERLQQDVWHDNFVPKYSALATVRPSRLILTGVWLIFAPMAIGSLITGLAAIADAPDLATAFILVVTSVVFGSIAVAILYTQTRRFVAANSTGDVGRDEDGDMNEHEELS